jgi:hypothetical protein
MVDRGANGVGLLLATDFPGPDDTHHRLVFNARGTRLAASCEKANHVIVFDPRSGREVARLGKLPFLSSMAFLSSEVLLIGQQCHVTNERRYPGRCVRWDLRRNSREIVREEKWLHNVAASPNGRLVVIAENGGLVLYEPARWRVRHRLAPVPGYGGGWGALFSCGGRYMAAVVYGGKQNLITVWNAEDGRRQRTFEAEQSARPVGFNGDTLTLAVGGGLKGLFLYKADGGEEPVATCPLEDYASAVQYRDRGLAVLLDSGGVISVHAETGRVQRQLAPPPDRVLRYATPNPDWSLFAAAAEGGVFVWKGA